MRFDRKKFYEGYRTFFGNLSDYQVDGLNNLLWGYETYYGWWNNIFEIANSLAQVGHETAWSYLPVVEGYYLAKNVPKDRRYFQGQYDVVRRYQKTLRYYPYFGIGHIQLTHKKNYAEQSTLIKKYMPEIADDFERRTGKPLDLVGNPFQMLDDKISFAAMTIGMQKGTFTGRSFDRYIVNGKPDYAGMRSMVNGDRYYFRKGAKHNIGTEIAELSVNFEKVLRNALIREDLTPDNISERIDELQKPAARPPSIPDKQLPGINQTEAETPGVFGATASPPNQTVGAGQVLVNPPQTETPPNNQSADSFIPRNLPAFIPQLSWKDKLWGLVPAGFGLSTIGGWFAGLPDWLVFLLGAITGIALWNFFQFIIKHREKVLEFITECYKKTADPTQNNLIPTPTPTGFFKPVGFRREQLEEALSEE